MPRCSNRTNQLSKQGSQLPETSSREAKECLDASKTSAGQVTEVAASDEEELPGDGDSSALQITTSIQTLSNSLQQLSKDAEAIQIEGPAAKRPRTEEGSAGEEAKVPFS